MLKAGLIGFALAACQSLASADEVKPPFPKTVDLSLGRIPFDAPLTQREIVDGDTVWMGIHEIRLFGIDTVEPKQDCRQGARNIDCHSETVALLRTFVSDASFRCEGFRVKDNKPWTSYGRYVGLCYTKSGEVNLAMVESGWALAEADDDSSIYKQAENLAKAKKLGLHGLTFEKPWIYRKNQRGNDCVCAE